MSVANATTILDSRQQRGLRIAERHRLRCKGPI